LFVCLAIGCRWFCVSEWQEEAEERRRKRDEAFNNDIKIFERDEKRENTRKETLWQCCTETNLHKLEEKRDTAAAEKKIKKTIKFCNILF
jgi:hypothetical protein